MWCERQQTASRIPPPPPSPPLTPRGRQTDGLGVDSASGPGNKGAYRSTWAASLCLRSVPFASVFPPPPPPPPLYMEWREKQKKHTHIHISHAITPERTRTETLVLSMLQTVVDCKAGVILTESIGTISALSDTFTLMMWRYFRVSFLPPANCNLCKQD